MLPSASFYPRTRHVTLTWVWTRTMRGPQFYAAPWFLKRGRFVHIPHQLLETNRQTAALVLCEKPAHFAGATVRLQNESMGMQRRQRGVECNPRPMSRKYR